MNLSLRLPVVSLKHVAIAVMLSFLASIAITMPVDEVLPQQITTAIDAITPDFLDELVGTSQADAWGWAKSAWNGVKKAASWTGNYVSNNWGYHLAGATMGGLVFLTCFAGTGGTGAVGCGYAARGASMGTTYLLKRYGS